MLAAFETFIAPVRAGAYYQCVESHFEELEQVWDDRYAPRFGFWRPYIIEVIH
jgi:hypothetical protein